MNNERLGLSPDVETVMSDYAPMLLRYATHLVRDPHAAQDVVQEVMIRYGRLDRERRPLPDKLRSWLFRVTHNQAVDLIRAEQRRRKLHENQAWEENAAGHGDAERLEEVRRWLPSLNEKERAVLLLRLQEGMSYQDISEVTGIGVGHVGSLLHHAVKRLSERIRTETQKAGRSA
jgi:RNA polymerase sigma factor (sigma-70 family)